MIEDSLLNSAEGPLTPDLEGLQSLLLSVRRGDHAMVASRALLAELARNNNLGAAERGTALSLHSRQSELMGLKRLSQFRVNVGPSGGNYQAWNDGNEWFIPASKLTNNFFQKTTLLAENSVDADLYIAAAEHYRIINRHKGVSVALRGVGGGGSQIDVELNSCARGGLIVLVITDGDKKYPAQRSSAVSRRCSAVCTRIGTIAFHAELDCYHIENIVPLEVYRDVLADEGRHHELDRLVVLGRAEGSPDQYICWKSGVSLGQVSKASDQSARRYWLEVIESIPEYGEQLRQCVNSVRCTERNCECMINEGFGADALRHVRDWVSGRSFQLSCNSFRSSAKWLDIGRIGFQFGMAIKENRV